MARKVRGFERVLDAPALFAIAYGEIGSSIYVALGIVAAAALGLTPLVLLLTGVVFLVVALSYAEGTAAIPETGGAETFTRRAFNDLVGRRRGVFGSTVDRVMRNAPCRVMVTASRAGATA